MEHAMIMGTSPSAVTSVVVVRESPPTLERSRLVEPSRFDLGPRGEIQVNVASAARPVGIED